MSKKLIFLFSLFCTLASFATTYNQADYEQYDTTGQCPNCDLSSATLFCQSESNLDGANLSNADFGDRHDCQNSSFVTAIANNADFGTSDYTGSNFSEAIMNDSSMDFATCSSCTFINTNLQDTNFFNAVLVRADFTGANLTGVNLEHTDLTQAQITQEQLDASESYCDAILPNGTKYNCD